MQTHEAELGNSKQKVQRDLENYRHFDIHKYSDHPEVNNLVGEFYDEYFSEKRANVYKRHIKVFLLDLFVCWHEDANQNIAVSLNRNTYRAKSRYNEQSVSNLNIDVLETLVEAELIYLVRGFFDRRSNTGRRARIWASPNLISVFEQVGFSILDIGYHDSRETIILRDEEKNDIEYEDSDETKAMADIVRRYNELLRRTFIDIPTNQNGYIVSRTDPNKKVAFIRQTSKFTRRIFNRSSFKYGGRFFGGWWQSCSSDMRSKIFMNDFPTTEIDFSGFHIVILYALKGINYWEEFGTDPYDIEKPDFIKTKEECRKIVKSLLLVMINADTQKTAFAGFRSSTQNSNFKSLKNEQLQTVQDLIEKKHPIISEYINSDAGAMLMNIDSNISEQIVIHFINQSTPILLVHDSYIINSGDENELIDAMCDSFKNVLGVTLSSKEARETVNYDIKGLTEKRQKSSGAPLGALLLGTLLWKRLYGRRTTRIY